MTRAETNREKWLLSGYLMFGQSGPDALKVERLSMLVGLNRSSFYHYFGDIFVFEKELIDYHINCYREISKELEDCKDFEHDVIHLINVNKDNIGFQRQLLINEAIPRYKEAMVKARSFTEDKIFRLWAKYEQDQKINELDKSLYTVVRDYCLIHFEQSQDDEVNNILSNVKIFVHQSTDKIS